MKFLLLVFCLCMFGWLVVFQTGSLYCIDPLALLICNGPRFSYGIYTSMQCEHSYYSSVFETVIMEDGAEKASTCSEADSHESCPLFNG